MPPARRRLVIYLGPLLGICLGCAFWLEYGPKGSGGPTDQWARSRGFGSADRYEAILALSHESKHLRDLTEQQFGLVQDVLDHDGPNAKTLAVVSLASLRTAEQQRRALRMVMPHVREKGVDAMIYFVVQTYARGSGRGAVEELARGPDPAIATWASKVLATVPSSTPAPKWPR